MTYPSAQQLSFGQFVTQYAEDLYYELADGKLISMELTGPHETVGGKLATCIGIAIAQAQHPWFIPRTCLIRPFAEVATARRPDIVVLDETALPSEPLWQQQPVITLSRLLPFVSSKGMIMSSINIG